MSRILDALRRIEARRSQTDPAATTATREEACELVEAPSKEELPRSAVGPLEQRPIATGVVLEMLDPPATLDGDVAEAAVSITPDRESDRVVPVSAAELVETPEPPRPPAAEPETAGAPPPEPAPTVFSLVGDNPPVAEQEVVPRQPLDPPTVETSEPAEIRLADLPDESEDVEADVQLRCASPEEAEPEPDEPAGCEEPTPAPMTVSETAAEEATSPEETVSNDVAPESTLPEQALPSETAHAETAAEEVFPAETNLTEAEPAEITPAENVTAEPASEEALSENTEPAEPAPAEMVPHDTTPEESPPAVAPVSPEPELAEPPEELAPELAELADNVLADLPPDRPAVILFTSPDAAVGKTATVAALASWLARQSDGGVLAVDANVWQPQLAAALEVETGPGLGAVLKGLVPWTDAVRTVSSTGLHVLPARPVAEDDKTSIDLESMGWLLEQVRGRYRMVLLDSASLSRAEMALLSRLCDGTCLIVRLGQTSEEDASAAVEILNASGARLLGCVVSDPSPPA